jgi:hypothetical protein
MGLVASILVLIRKKTSKDRYSHAGIARHPGDHTAIEHPCKKPQPSMLCNAGWGVFGFQSVK